MATALPTPILTATALAAPASGTSRHLRRAVARALCPFDEGAGRFVACASRDGVLCASIVTGESEMALTGGCGPTLEREVLPSVVVSTSMVMAEPVLPSEAQSSAGMSPTERWAPTGPEDGTPPFLARTARPSTDRRGSPTITWAPSGSADGTRPFLAWTARPSTDRRGSPPITWAPRARTVGTRPLLARPA